MYDRGGAGGILVGVVVFLLFVSYWPIVVPVVLLVLAYPSVYFYYLHQQFLASVAAGNDPREKL